MKNFYKNIYLALILIPVLSAIAVGNSNCDFDSNPTQALKTIFIENRGQILPDEKGFTPDYYIRGEELSIFISKEGLKYSFKKIRNPGDSPEVEVENSYVWFNTDGDAAFLPDEPLTTKFNFYYPHCRDGITNVPAYKRLVLKNVYNNIDMQIYPGKINNSLKYDLILHPGADADDIEFEYETKGKLILESNEIKIDSEIGSIREQKPFAFIKGKKDRILKEVPCTYNLSDNNMNFNLPEYDKNQTLVIDPNIIWSTFYGGETNGDHAIDIERDPNGDFIIAGYTLSNDFPVKDAEQDIRRGFYDAWLMKMNNVGDVLWATYFGGEETDYARDIAVDQFGRTFMVGITWSVSSFPTTQTAWQRSHLGPFPGGTDGFVSRFYEDGTLVWCTYYGGYEDDHLYSVTTNGEQEIAITGWSASDNFHLPSNTKNHAGLEDAVVFTMTYDCVPLWGTFIGGSGTDAGRGITYDSDGKLVATGYTESLNFPLENVDASDRQTVEDAEVFVAKFDVQWQTGSTDYVHIFGGLDREECYAISPAEDGKVVICGRTDSRNFPVFGSAYQGQNAGRMDAFVSKVNTLGKLEWSTYFGGTRDDIANALVVDAVGNITVTGETMSPDLETSAMAIQKEYSGPPEVSDAMAFKFDKNGMELLWSTYIGGTSNDWGFGIATDIRMNPMIVGATSSEEFPVYRAYQETLAGAIDAFIMKICRNEPKPLITILGDMPFCPGDSVALFAEDGHRNYYWSDGQVGQKIYVKDGGEYYCTVVDTGGCMGESNRVFVETLPLPVPEITGDLEFCEEDSTELTVEGDFISMKWSDGVTDIPRTIKVPGIYIIEVQGQNGCFGYDTVSVIENPNPQTKIHGPEVVCAESEGIFYWINTEAENINIWSVEGGVLDYGVDSLNVTVDWGASGTGKVMVSETNQITGCTGYDTLIVTISDKLMPEIMSDIGDFDICEGDSIELDAGPGYAYYKWNTGANTQKIWVKTSGEYDVLVRDNSGCEGVDTVLVSVFPNPAPTISGENNLCAPAMNEIYSTPEVSGHSYSWTVVNGDITSGHGTNQVTIDWPAANNAKILLTETNDITGCMASTEYDVTINPTPEPIIQALGDTEFCDGESVTLDAGAGYDSYEWTGGETSRTISVYESGDYSVKVTNSSGCVADSDPVRVTVHPLPDKPLITRQEDSLYCTDAFSYQWILDEVDIPGANQKKYVPDESGYYSVRVTNEFGCEAESDTVYFWKGVAGMTLALPDTVFSHPGQDVELDISIESSFNLDLIGAYEYDIYLRYNSTMLMPFGSPETIFNDGYTEVIKLSGTRTGETGVLHSLKFLATLGTDECTEVHIDSLVWKDAERIDIYYSHGYVCYENLCRAGGSPRLFDPNGIIDLGEISPSPVKEKATINYSLIEDGQTEVYLTDASGGRVLDIKSEYMKKGPYSEEIDTGNLASGIYFCILQTASHTLVRRMIIVK